MNRHYVMTSVLGRKGARDYLKLAQWQVFGLAEIAARGRESPVAALREALRGIRDISRSCIV
jgi:hypothetical protein